MHPRKYAVLTLKNLRFYREIFHFAAPNIHGNQTFSLSKAKISILQGRETTPALVFPQIQGFSLQPSSSLSFPSLQDISRRLLSIKGTIIAVTSNRDDSFIGVVTVADVLAYLVDPKVRMLVSLI